MTSKTIRNDFSFDSYKQTLNAYQQAGYELSSFDEYLEKSSPQHVILRHDIDNSFEQAMRIAKIENEQGCTSTYFLRVHARGYNLFSLESVEFINQLEDFGHEVQLHLEGGFKEVFGGSDIDWANRQKSAFEAVTGRKLGGFSSHEPARMGGVEFANTLLNEWSESVRYHAYEERFFPPNMKYLSDSSARWREGHFCEWIGKEPLLQVLTHPIWWYEKIPAENY